MIGCWGVRLTNKQCHIFGLDELIPMMLTCDSQGLVRQEVQTNSCNVCSFWSWLVPSSFSPDTPVLNLRVFILTTCAGSLLRALCCCCCGYSSFVVSHVWTPLGLSSFPLLCVHLIKIAAGIWCTTLFFSSETCDCTFIDTFFKVCAGVRLDEYPEGHHILSIIG